MTSTALEAWLVIQQKMVASVSAFCAEVREIHVRDHSPFQGVQMQRDWRWSLCHMTDLGDAKREKEREREREREIMYGTLCYEPTCTVGMLKLHFDLLTTSM